MSDDPTRPVMIGFVLGCVVGAGIVAGIVALNRPDRPELPPVTDLGCTAVLGRSNAVCRDGTWSVGQWLDLDPGVYRTEGPIDEKGNVACVWYLKDQAGDYYVNPDRWGITHIAVEATLEPGYYFETEGCKPWRKVRN